MDIWTFLDRPFWEGSRSNWTWKKHKATQIASVLASCTPQRVRVSMIVRIKNPQTVNLFFHDPRLWCWYLLQMNSGCATNHGVCRSPNAKRRVMLLMWLTQKPHDFLELYTEPWLASVVLKRLCVGVLPHSVPHLGELWMLGGGKERLSPVRLEQSKMFLRVLEVEATFALGTKNRLNWEKYLFSKVFLEKEEEYLLVWGLMSSLPG